MTDVLSHFNAVRKSGSGWIAKCPAHDDRQASLSIGRGDRQPWLFDCKAGCSLESILGAAGLTLADISNPRQDGKDKPQTTTYKIRDLDGRVVALHERVPDGHGGKRFVWRQPNGTSGLNGRKTADLPLYGAERLCDLPAGSIVVLAEGERACGALLRCGIAALGTVTGASGTPSDDVLRALIRYRVRLWADADAPGRDHMARIAARLQALGCTDVAFVVWPEAPEHGDAADWLKTGRTKDELIALVMATNLSEISGRSTGSNLSADTLDLVTLSDVTPEAISWIWPGRLALGKYTLLAGDPGLGKSTVQLAIASHLSRGTAWPDSATAPQGKTLILSAEDGIADTIRPRLDRLHADASQVVVLRAVRDASGARPLNLARDLDRLADAIARVKPLVVGIDPITAYLGKTDSYKDAEMRGLLAPLLALLEQERVALLAVGHLSKSDQRAALHRPGGSIAFVAAARIALCLAADPNDADRRVLAGLKSNLGPLPASLAFRLPEGRLEWEAGPALDLDAEALLRPPAPKDRDEDTNAEHVLRELLADTSAWPLEALHAIEAGKAHGISERTMQRTAKRLGVGIRRLGFGRGGKWLWHAPPIDDIPDSRAPISVPLAPMAPMRNQAGIGVTTHIDDTTTCTSNEDHDERL